MEISSSKNKTREITNDQFRRPAYGFFINKINVFLQITKVKNKWKRSLVFGISKKRHEVGRCQRWKNLSRWASEQWSKKKSEHMKKFSPYYCKREKIFLPKHEINEKKLQAFRKPWTIYKWGRKSSWVSRNLRSWHVLVIFHIYLWFLEF